MKKSILFVVLALFCLLLPGQEQDQEQIPVLPEEPPQVEAEEPVPAQEPPLAPPVQLQGRDLKKVRIPQSFIHAGKEYPAGDYWMVLASRDGQSYFAVQDAAKEPLFEELAIVKPRHGGTVFRVVGRQLTTDREFYRIKVAAPGEWLYGFFLVKK
jgi:hypothetical protein